MGNTQKPEQDEKGRFVAGNSGNGGRPKGSRNKLGEAFLDNLYADWRAHGAQALKDCRETNPAAYIKTVASLLPKQVEVNANGLSSMSDDELNHLIDAIRAADGAAIAPRSGKAKTGRAPVAH